MSAADYAFRAKTNLPENRICGVLLFEHCCLDRSSCFCEKS